MFYFAAMSPYSWMSAERIEQVLPDARWRPVTAAFIFKAAGRTPWGLTDQRDAGIADCEQRARCRASAISMARAVADQRHPGRPRHDVRRLDRPAEALRAQRDAARVPGRREPRTARVAARGRRTLRHRRGALASGIEDPAVKEQLRESTDEASALGVFGVPTVIAAGALFWGDDRLDEAARAHATQAGA